MSDIKLELNLLIVTIGEHESHSCVCQTTDIVLLPFDIVIDRC